MGPIPSASAAMKRGPVSGIAACGVGVGRRLWRTRIIGHHREMSAPNLRLLQGRGDAWRRMTVVSKSARASG